MIRVKRTPLLALVATLAAAAPAPAPAPADSAAVAAILTRTKTVTRTYALYIWTVVTPPAEPRREEWAAEFHSGDLHRVETPRDRIVANCRTGEGWGYSVETGERFTGAWLARTACGVDTNQAVSSAEYEGTRSTPFGPADRVKLVTPELIRRYDVSPEGILLAETFTANGPGEAIRLSNRAVALEAALPASGMFEPASLARSYVADRYRHPPAAR